MVAGDANRSVRAQQQSPWSDPVPIIRVSSNFILVPVSVTDSAGQPVENLKLDDFQVEEEGKRQPLVSIAPPGKSPVELALLLDVSGSVLARFDFERQAASRFLREVLRPSDAASIVAIGAEPRLVQPRTQDGNSAIGTLLQLDPTKNATAFFDAVTMAARHLRNTAMPGARRVLIAISDGEDNHSDRCNLSDALREVQQTDAVFYSINPSGPSIRLNRVSRNGQAVMQALASHTGGAAFLPEKLEDLDAVFKRIASELQTQYVLAYYSTAFQSDGRFIPIAVRIPKRPQLRIRARQGYYAIG